MKSINLGGGLTQRWQRRLLVFLLGVLMTSAVLLISQPTGWQPEWGVRSRSIEAAYRYPFDRSLPRNRNPVLGLQREIATYQQQVQRYPDSGLEQAALAASYLKMARLTGEESWYLLAEQTAEQSFAKLPFENREAINVLARVAEARHDFATALKLAEQDLKPEEAAAIRTTSNLAMGKLPAASQAVDTWVDAVLSPAAFTMQGIVRYAQGKDQAALESFRYALEVEEAGDWQQSARIRTLLGRFYYERGQLEQAAALYREALHILPAYPAALLNLAQLEIRQGKLAEANRRYAQLQTATNGNPTIYTALILRGQARIKQLQGNLAAAEPLWSEAEMRLRQGLSSTNSFGHRRDLARLLLERSRPQDRAEAVALMATETKLRRDAATLDTYAWALMQAGNPQQANPVIQEAIASGTRDAAIFDRASAIVAALGNTTQAETYLRQAKNLDPQFGERAQQANSLGVGMGE
jgi:tetratricopeptide (TPR) repeat protein